MRSSIQYSYEYVFVLKRMFHIFYYMPNARATVVQCSPWQYTAASSHQYTNTLNVHFVFLVNFNYALRIKHTDWMAYSTALCTVNIFIPLLIGAFNVFMMMIMMFCAHSAIFSRDSFSIAWTHIHCVCFSSVALHSQNVYTKSYMPLLLRRCVLLFTCIRQRER